MTGAPVESSRIFYLHVMKTAGGTFSRYLRAHHRFGAVYPEKGLDDDLETATFGIDYLLGLPPERHQAITVYTGHFPSVVADLLDVDLVRVTILRDPVERTLSYLRHCRTYNPQHRDVPLEEIYEDPFQFTGFIHDHQTKQFSMTRDDPLTTFFQTIDVDDHRLAIARANLARIDVVGLSEQFPAFVDDFRARVGYGPLEVEDLHRSDGRRDVPASFRRRIAEDNAIDMAFYEYARDLVRERRLELA